MLDSLRYSITSRLHTDRMAVRVFLAEWLGTFTLVFIGLSANVQFVANIANGSGSVVSLQLAWGLAFAFSVYLAAAVSGAHLNPAFTLAVFLLDGTLSAKRMLLYWVAQMQGAFVGAAFAYMGHLDDVRKIEMAARWSQGNGSSEIALTPIAGLFATYPAEHMSLLGALGDQTIGTAILAGCIVLILDKRNRIPAGMIPLLAGFVMTMVAMSYGANTGFAINPARDAGPRLFLLCAGYGWVVVSARNYYFWVPLVGPVLGALIGISLYKLFVGMHGPSLAESAEFDRGKGVGKGMEDGVTGNTVKPTNRYRG